MVKQRRGKELPKGKPRGRGKDSSSTRSQRNILEREQQIQETLRPSEECYRTLAEQSLMGLVVVRDFRIIFTNAAFAEISGYSIDELLSLQPEEVLAMVHPEDQALVWGRLRDRLAGKAAPPHYQCRIIRRDGAVRWLEMHANRIEYDGELAIQGAIIDITERKQAEEALHLQDEILYNMAEGVVITRTKDAVIVYTNPKFEEMFGYGPGELIGKGISVVNAPTDKSPEELARDIQRDLKETGVWQGEICNIKKDGTFFWCHANISTFNHHEHGNVWVDAHTDITERKRTEEALHFSERNFRDSIEKSPLGIRIVTADGKTLYVNKALLDICGYGSFEELKAMPRDQLYTPESYVKHRERVRGRQQREHVPSDYEISIVRKDGQVRWLSVSRGEVLWNGEKQFQVVYQDITEHKRVDEALRESEERYRALCDRSLDCVFVHDFEGNFLDANEVALKLLGYEREDIPHLNFASLLSQDQLPTTFATLQELKDTGAQKEVNEFRIRCKDGSFVDVEVIGAVIYHEGKPYAIQGIGRDITVRKRAEEALRQSEEKYRTILEEMEDAYFEVDLGGHFTFVNNSVCRDLGYSREELIGMSYKDFTIEDDIESVFQVFNEVYRTGVPNKGFPWKTIRKDGSHGFAETSVSPLRNDKGEIIGFRGVGRDVTECKVAEEKLRQSRENYRALFDSSVISTLVVDAETMRVLIGNQAAVKLFGFNSAEEGAGVNLLDFVPPEDKQKDLELIVKEVFEQDLRRTHELQVVTKDGKTIWISATGAKITHGGRLAGLLSFTDVTERKRVEEALRQSEERYRTILEEMKEGYYEVDIAGNFTFVNDAMSRILGYSRDELIGINYKIYMPKEDGKAVFEAYNRVYRTGEPLKWFPMVEVRKDGTRILVEDSVLPMRNDKGEVIGFRGVSRDVTERRRVEEALRQSEERYRTILEEMEDSYFEVDLAGNFTFVNNSACRHLGYSREELIGMSYKSFTAKDYMKSVFRVFNEVYKTAVTNKGFHWKIICKDGSPGFIDTSVAPLQNGKGEIIGFSSVGRDVTERKKIEDQFILTDRLASIGQLAAGIAHELNNPLTAVIGFSDLLLEKDLTADVKEDLETINREAVRTIDIIKGLLAFAREQRIGKTLVDINSIIQGVLQLRSYEQRVNNIEVDARFAPALPLVMGNAAQLQQVFINLVINAEQAMLEVHKRGKITIVTKRVRGIVRASFTDDGQGINPNNIKQIFAPFFTTREVGKGTGLGLSICHGIVTEHLGKIYAESEPGEGATFVIELPISK